MRTLLYLPEENMLLCCWLALVALVPLTLSTDAGVKVKLTGKGLEYGKSCLQQQKTMYLQAFVWNCSCLFLGRQLGMATMQQKLKSIKVPDQSGTEKVSPIGKVQYSLSK